MTKVVEREFLVVGAGAVGSAVAYHLAKRGRSVTLLEQFELGHKLGSSHGACRITRHSYADPFYAHLMVEAFAAWRTLERDSCRPLYIKTGGVSFSPPGVDYVARVAENLKAVGVEYNHLGGDEFSQFLPQFQLSSEFEAVYEPDAGLLAADRCTATQRELAASWGAEIRGNCPVLRIEQEGQKAVAVTADTKYVVEKLIVTAGSWVGKLRPALAKTFRPTRQRVLFYEPDDIGPWGVGRFPVFIYKGAADSDAYYGTPCILGTGVKVGQHWGPDVDPDAVDRQIEPEYNDTIGKFVGSYLPDLAQKSATHGEVCLYTVSPEDDFRVDFDPEMPNVIIASPCSGHGFKFSCLMGSILADLATTGETKFDRTPWKLRPGEC